MPEGKTIDYQDGEYPALDGLQDGAQVKFTGSATIQDGGDGSKQLLIDQMDFETEGPADRELRNMRGPDNTQQTTPNASEGDGDSF